MRVADAARTSIPRAAVDEFSELENQKIMDTPKKLFLTLGWVGLSVAATRAQGTIQFRNSPLSKIEFCDTIGAPLVDAPVGTVVGVFWGRSPDVLTLVEDTATITTAGLFNKGSAYPLPGSDPGEAVFFKIAAWYTEGGITPTLARQGARSPGITHYGESSVVVTAPLGSPAGSGTAVFQSSTGTNPNRAKPFALCSVPEPPLAGTIAFAGGTAAGAVPAAGAVFYSVSAPADAARWIHSATHVAGVHVNIQEGWFPTGTSDDAYQSSGANSSLNRSMGANVSHWRPGQNYYLAVFNPTAAAQPYSITLNGLTTTTDADADGLPDAWELSVFNNLTAAHATSDADRDGVRDLDEFVLGTNPRDASTRGALGLPSFVVGGFVELSFQGEAGQEYELQRSVNFPVWTSLVHSTATGQLQFLRDLAPTPAGLSVYRTVLIPDAARARAGAP